MQRTTTSPALRLAKGTTMLASGAVALMLAGFAPALEAQELTMVLSPPSNETNRFWSGGSDFTFPPMQSLVGNDAETGQYDGSGLAASWEPNEDFTVWTFHLHPDAEFHFDWGPVTAADVLHSYELHTGPESTLTGVAFMVADEVEVVDDHTIRFHLPESRINYPFAHAGRGSLFIYSKAQYDAEGLQGYDQRPAGTGQLQFVSRDVGRGVTFERVENHWSGTDAAYDQLELRFVAEGGTQLALLLAGEADLVALPRELHPDALAAGFEVISSTGPAMQTTFLFNGLYMEGDPAYRPDLPWADVRIREAVNRSVDREVMIDLLYGGNADRLTQFLMDPRHEGYAPELEERFEEMYGYDPARAKALLDEAGYPDAFDDPVIPIISSTLAGNPEWPTTAELLQSFMHEVGFRTEIRELDWAGVNTIRRAREAHVFHPMRNAPVRPTDVGLDLFFSSAGRPTNVYENEISETLSDKYRASLDTEERDMLARQIFTHHFENYTSLPIATVTTDVIVNPKTVAGWTYPGVTSAGFSHFHLIEPAS